MPIDVEISTLSDQSIFHCYGRNISIGGMYVELASQLEKNSQVQMRFKLPGAKRPFTIQGEVVWNEMRGLDNTWGCGIRFISLTPEEMQEVMNYTQTMQKVIRPRWC
jgi:uncharacterized protein (TIGR02266 family)